MKTTEMHLKTANVASFEANERASTQSFYEDRAGDYFDRTVAADMSQIYKRFFGTLEAGARILDLGAGSGRDLKAMRLAGFEPLGIDSSPKLARMAELLSGVRCLVMRFEDLAFDEKFDGAWACASLLHLPKKVLPSVLDRLRSSLEQHASFYISVISGEGEETLPDGRFFAFYSPSELQGILEKSGFIVQQSWMSDDSISKERNTRWVNIIVRPS